jgi:hypothetical protein
VSFIQSLKISGHKKMDHENSSALQRLKVPLLTGRGRPKVCETSRHLLFFFFYKENGLTDGGEFVSVLHIGRPLPQGRFLVLVSIKG